MNYFYFKFAESLNKEYYFDRNRSGNSFEISLLLCEFLLHTVLNESAPTARWFIVVWQKLPFWKIIHQMISDDHTQREGGQGNLAGPSSKKTQSQKQKTCSQPDPHSKPQIEACKTLDWVMVSYIDVYWILNEPVWKQSFSFYLLFASNTT